MISFFFRWINPTERTRARANKQSRGRAHDPLAGSKCARAFSILHFSTVIVEEYVIIRCTWSVARVRLRCICNERRRKNERRRLYVVRDRPANGAIVNDDDSFQWSRLTRGWRTVPIFPSLVLGKCHETPRKHVRPVLLIVPVPPPDINPPTFPSQSLSFSP